MIYFYTIKILFIQFLILLLLLTFYHRLFTFPKTIRRKYKVSFNFPICFILSCINNEISPQFLQDQPFCRFVIINYQVENCNSPNSTFQHHLSLSLSLSLSSAKVIITSFKNCSRALMNINYIVHREV